MLDAADVSVTPSRQRRPLRSAADSEVDGEDHLSQDDDASEVMQQRDVTVCFARFLAPFCDI